MRPEHDVGVLAHLERPDAVLQAERPGGVDDGSELAGVDALLFHHALLAIDRERVHARWQLVTDNGASISCRYYIMATGCLSAPKPPEIDGVKDFKGAVYFTGRWPHDGVDLAGKRVALLAHPASVTRDLVHTLDALAALGDIDLTAAFGPQHGLRGDKQDNMVESEDFTDPVHQIPVFSLYGEVRRPTGQSMGTFDTILIDMQDLGCRIYTFITTLLYVIEAAAAGLDEALELAASFLG